MKLIFATQNPNKVKEISKMLPPQLKIVSLNELNFLQELEETQSTLEGNALQKARYVFEQFSQNCFAEDTGLEVGALNGEPGVFSARYAGEQKNMSDNISLLLKNLENEADRKARFRTVIALILDGKEYLFEGIVSGKIIDELRGSSGFGYDPVFVPDGCEKTFAQFTFEEKNSVSHRARAFEKMKSFLAETVAVKKKPAIHQHNE